jgi:hypothetical protein
LEVEEAAKAVARAAQEVTALADLADAAVCKVVAIL